MTAQYKIGDKRIYTISAFRSGRRIRFSISFDCLIGRDEATDENLWQSDSAVFSAFEEAKKFADENGGALIGLRLAGLGVAHKTSNAGFPVRGENVLTATEKTGLSLLGFDVSTVRVVDSI